MEISSNTDKGVVRKNNEDSLLVIPPWSNASISKKACLFLVADGMGGQNAGEVASHIAVNYTREWFNQNSLTEITTKLVDDLINSANEKVWEYSQKHPETSGMGTTFTTIIIKGNKAVIGHIGDSRIYRLNNNKLTQLTNDHSIVGEQVRLGKLTPNQARVHPARSILSKVLGARQFIKADVFEIEIAANDEFIMCTDGIYGMLDCEKIEEIIKTTETEKLANKLIEAANNAGGSDNSTVIAFKLSSIPIKIPSLFSFSRILKLFINCVYIC